MPFSGFHDLDQAFARSLQQMVAANPGISPFSGYRSIARQQQLWDASDKTGHMVARPGHSQHNFGRAADLHFADAAAEAWAHEHARDYNLTFPMSWERWHIEPIGARSGPHSSPVGDLGPDNSGADRPGLLEGPGPWGAEGLALPTTQADSGLQYHRPLPFEEGFGGQQFMEGLIGGTLRQDLRAAIGGRISRALFG